MSAYILPPVTAESINTTDARFSITDAMLISSNVPETPPAAYVNSTLYPVGAEVSTGAAGGVLKVWRAKFPAVGHPPDSSPDWWQWLGDTYALWNGTTAWAVGSLVIRVEPGTHSVYRRLAPDPTTASATPPEQDAYHWARVGTTNRWAMFDILSAAPTVVPGSLAVVIAPGSITGLALIDIDGGECTLAMSVAGEGVVWTHHQYLDGTYIGSWEDYWLEPFDPLANLILRDIPGYLSGELSITISGGTGTISVGRLVAGVVQPVGRLLVNPKVREKSFTTVERDKYSSITDINKQPSIPWINGTLLVPKELVRKARRAFSSARAAPCIFIGLDNDQDEYADLVTLPAICLDFDVDPAYPTDALINFELEGV